MRSTEQLHQDVLTLLAPVTRDRYTYTGTGRTRTPVNPAGIDLHDGDVDTVAQGPDGTAHPYIALSTSGRTEQHHRFSGGGSQALFTVRLTLAAGSPQSLRWALDRLDPALTRARLHRTTGFLVPYFDPVEAMRADDASPTRWYTHLRYSITVR